MILGLSAFESEWFLLVVIFLTPVDWLPDTGMLVRDVMTAMRILVAAGFFLGLLWRGRLDLRRPLRLDLSRWSIAFAAAVALSTTFGSGGWTHNSTRCFVVVASSIMFYFVVVSWADSKERVKKLLKVLLCSTIVVSAFGILQFVFGGYTWLWQFLYPEDLEFIGWSGRVSSFLRNPNSLAGYLNLLLPFALATFVLGDGTWKRVGAVCALLGFVSLSLTQSRAGLVAFGCVLLAAIFVFVRRRRNRLLLVGGLAALALSFYSIGSAVNPEHFGGLDVGTALGRPLLWITAWDLFAGSPFWGTGLGNFTGLYGSYVHVPWIPPDQLTVNSLYLELLSETGVVGFGVFYFLSISAIRGGYLHFRHSRCNLSSIVGFGLFGAMVTVFVHGLLDLSLEVSPQFDILLWLVFALYAADVEVREKLERPLRYGTSTVR
jgi:O-antigen ligase